MVSEFSGSNLCQSATSYLSTRTESLPFSYQSQVLSLYLPTTDSPLTLYKECLQELENVIFSLQTDGPVLVMGDFNAHIG